MKKKLLTIIISLAAALCLCFGISACAKVVYKLNFIVDNEVYATIDTSGEESITMPHNPTKEDYLFDGWYWDKGIWQRPFTADSLLHEKLTSNMSVYAKWLEEDVTKKSYTVTFNSMGGSPIANATVKYGALVSKPADPTRMGYIFAGWYRDAATTDKWNFDADTVAKNITLYAMWVDESTASGCEILKADGFTVEGNALSVVVPHVQEYFALSEVITVSPYATWTVSSDIGGNSISPSATVSLVAGDNTFYINITSGNGSNKKQYTVNIRRREIYTVTYQLNNGDTDIVEHVEEGQKIENKQAERTGYSFTEWQYQGAAWNFGQGIGESMTLTATWQANSYTVTFDSADGSAANETTVTYDAEFEFEVPTRKGYTFNGWKTADGTLLTDGDGKGKDVWKIADDTELTAAWTAVQYTITYHDVNDATNNNQTSYTVESDDITLSDAVKTGYNFLGWYNTQDGGDRIYKITVADAKNINLWARWELTKYTATFKADDLETDTVQFTIKDDTIEEPPVPNKKGYTGAWDDYTLGAHDITIEAIYTPIDYTIHYSNTKNAKNSNRETYNIETKTFTLQPLVWEGYHFDGWYEGDTQVTEIHVGTTGEKYLSARWSPVDYTIHYSNTKEAENANRETYNVETETFSLEPLTKNGYEFQGWFEHGQEVTEIQVGSMGDKYLEAKWNRLDYAIQYEGTKDAENHNKTLYNVEDDTFDLLPLETPGYKFTGWYDEHGPVTQIEQGSYGEKTLTAHWELVKYTITYQNTKNATNSNKTEYTIEDETFPLQPLSVTGFTFVCWYDSGTPIAEIVHGSYGNKVLIASWKEYSLEEIRLDENKLAVKETDEINAELFNATCKDSNGDFIEVQVSYSGTLKAGETINVVFIAQAEGAQPARKSLLGVKVYGMPTLEVKERDKDYLNLPEGLIGEQFGASGKDTFGEATQIKVVPKEDCFAGQIIDFVIQSIDPAGNITEELIKNVRVYDAPVISYDEGKSGIRAEDYLSADLFSATAEDSFGESVSVKVSLQTGKQAVGNVVTVRLSATDTKGNVNNIDLTIQVYGAPTIGEPTRTDFKVEDEITPQSLGLTAVDTFDQPLLIALERTQGEQTAGEIMKFVATVTDAAGNQTTEEITVKIYGLPEITVERRAVKDTETIDIQTINASAADSFHQSLEVTLTFIGGNFAAGDSVFYTVSATDKLGNVKTLENVTIKVYSEDDIQLTCFGGASQVVKETSHGEEFSAYATDSFGEECSITLETEDGMPLTAGTVTSLYIVATDAAGNVKKSDLITDIKVYGMPTLALAPEFVYSTTEFTSLSPEFKVLDSFGRELFFQIDVDKAVISATRITVTVTATDVAGNVFSQAVDYFVSENGYDYKLDGENLWLISYYGTSEYVYVADGCTGISQNAFEKSSQRIKYVKIPQSIKEIDAGVFDDCTALVSFTVDEDNAAFSSLHGILYNEEKTEFVCIPQGLAGSITIPNTISSIGAKAFYNRINLTSVVISEGVTSIGYHAFYQCTSLESITIPESVTSIDDKAFEGCPITTATMPTSAIGKIPKSSLQTVTLTSGDSIGYGAFSGCTSLASIVIPESVTSIGDYAFGGCTRLESITIPDSVTAIGWYALKGCTSLESITIPKNVTSIGDRAFRDCTSLATVYWNATNCATAGSNDRPIFDGCTALTTAHIGKNVESIPEYAFYNCTSLVSVDFGANSSLNSIGNYAFFGCKLVSVDFGANSSLNSIGERAFYGCTSLESITIPERVTSVGNYAFYGCTSLASITIPESVTSIGTYALKGCTSLATVYWNATNCETAGSSSYPIFEGCTALTTVYIGENVESIPEYAFYNCKNLTTVYWNATNCKTAGSYDRLIFAGCKALTTVYFGENVESIPASAFTGCKSLESITIPDSVTSIGSSAFDGCTSLVSVTIPESVTSIGDWAFYSCTSLATVYWNATNCKTGGFGGCTALTTVYFGENVESIPASAFYNCTSLESITIPESVTSIGSSAFYNCTCLPSIFIIPESVTSIGSSAFSGCTGLVSVDFGTNSSLTSIGGSAFEDCTSLEGITIPESVTSIGSSAFSGCTGLVSVDFGTNSSLTSIGSSAFEDCTSLESITIPESVTSIGSSAFSGCTGLASVDFGTNSSLTSIGNYAFEDCTSLESITIPESVTSIGGDAFSGCTGLVSVDFGANSSLTSIGIWAFYGCTSLESITIPESITTIGISAFYGCTSLANVYYGGNPTQWGRILIGSHNDNLTKAARYYYSEGTPSAEQWAERNNWWHYDPDTGEIQIWKKES